MGQPAVETKIVEEKSVKIVAGQASLELRPNGDILVNGLVAENDKAVVEGMRKLIAETPTTV